MALDPGSRKRSWQRNNFSNLFPKVREATKNILCFPSKSCAPKHSCGTDVEAKSGKTSSMKSMSTVPSSSSTLHPVDSLRYTKPKFHDGKYNDEGLFVLSRSDSPSKRSSVLRRDPEQPYPQKTSLAPYSKAIACQGRDRCFATEVPSPFARFNVDVDELGHCVEIKQFDEQFKPECFSTLPFVTSSDFSEIDLNLQCSEGMVVGRSTLQKAYYDRVQQQKLRRAVRASEIILY